MGSLLVTTKEEGQRSKQKKETETSESSDTLRREEQGSEIEHSVLASAHTGQNNRFPITLIFPKTVRKSHCEGGVGLSEQRRGIGKAQKSRWHKVLATVPPPSMQQKCTKGLSYLRGLKCEENKKSTVRGFQALYVV